MRGIMETSVEDPGAVPGASTHLTNGKEREITSTTEQCSVKIVKPLSLQSGNALENQGNDPMAGMVDFPVCKGCREKTAVVSEDGFCPVCVKPAKPRRPRMPVPVVPPKEPSQPAVRVCGYTECTCILGPEVEGAFCAVHRRAIAEERMRLTPEGKCARLGCVRPNVQGSIWCSGHAACDASVTCDNLPAMPEGGRDFAGNHEGGDYETETREAEPPSGSAFEQALADALDAAWYALSDNEALDPRTVAVCKRLRDMEVRR